MRNFLSHLLTLLLLSGCGGGDIKLIQVGAVPPSAIPGVSTSSSAMRDRRTPFWGWSPEPAFFEMEKSALRDAGVYFAHGVCMAELHSLLPNDLFVGFDSDTPWVVFTIAEQDLSRAQSLGFDVVMPDSSWQEVACDWREVSILEQTVNGIRLPNF